MGDITYRLGIQLFLVQTSRRQPVDMVVLLLGQRQPIKDLPYVYVNGQSLIGFNISNVHK